ncbi:ribbon-helix-helix protein, CopG family [Crocosphaera sp.]|uniref:plasmid mobilization protein n=1 Tax=Crocosphaera sp. TaxID=2729996 RepID=UPI00261F6B2A|nr:ribbon-helix-helix protein, CopG family [Crocosphaera sp.]MDJ0582571.1 ribbon-helix-helix protein, CopG family [Crocosphaera sp.]
MARDKSIKVRLTDDEFERITLYAKSKGFSVSEVIRDYIKRLPKRETVDRRLEIE